MVQNYDFIQIIHQNLINKTISSRGYWKLFEQKCSFKKIFDTLKMKKMPAIFHQRIDKDDIYYLIIAFSTYQIIKRCTQIIHISWMSRRPFVILF